MSDWYYSTDRRQPNGPVDSTTLQRLINSGQLPPQARKGSGNRTVRPWGISVPPTRWPRGPVR